jgi:hypothetical protein
MLMRLLPTGFFTVVLFFMLFCAQPGLAGQLGTSLNEVKQAILNAIGSEPAAVELTATKGQFIITLVNSNLTSGLAPRRESEASRIAEGIAGVIAEMPEYQGIQAIHIGYVSRKPDGSASRIIDGTDFRKDPQGKFQDHIT